MCGMIGCVLSAPALPVLIDGLSHLTYRGYDSSGLALQEKDGSIRTFKTVGSIDRLASHWEAILPFSHETTGIGHNRWATHGGVTVENAHPHTYGSITVVHNGIFQAFYVEGKAYTPSEYHQFYTQQGHLFQSETDTELFAHWLFHKSQALHGHDHPLQKALQEAMEATEGHWAVLVLDASQPHHLYVAKKGLSPLAIAFQMAEQQADTALNPRLPLCTEHEPSAQASHAIRETQLLSESPSDLVQQTSLKLAKADIHITQEISHADETRALKSLCYTWFAASDSAVFPTGAKGFFLESGDVCVLSPQGYVWESSLQNKQNHPHAFSLDQALVFKRTIRPNHTRGHHMRHELEEQPESLNRWTKQAPVLWETLKALDLSQSSFYTFVGCGSAYFATCFGVYWFQKQGLLAQSYIASELVCQKPSIQGPVVFISQSGETLDVLAAASYAHTQQVPMLALINRENSTLSRLPLAFVWPTHAGPEMAVASTKSFLNQMVSLVAIGLHILRAPEETRQSFLREVQEAFDGLSACDSAWKTLQTWASLFTQGAKPLFFLGQGGCYTIAQEGALKWKEMTASPAEGLASGELKHGPLAMMEERSYTVYIAYSGISPEKHLGIFREIQARGGSVALITDTAGKKRWQTDVALCLALSATSELSFLLQAASMVQILSYYGALAHGFDPDRPRHLAKSVTVE